MAGNSLGTLVQLTTFGESHGEILGGILDGIPAGMYLCETDLEFDLDRRKPGNSKFVTKRKESDLVKIVSGVFEGKTTGAPIGLLVKNEDIRSQDYSEMANVFRPNHADFTYFHKYKHYDHRGGGRASARETVIRVAAGAIAKKYLHEQFEIKIRAYLSQMGNIFCEKVDFDFVNQNPFFCGDPEKIFDLEKLIQELIKEGDSIGAKITMIAENIPIGLGEPIFDRLDSDLAHALMSINAAKGVEIGDGFMCVFQKGSEFRDEITNKGFLSNHSGGILGGISSGQKIIAHVAFKPTSSIKIPGKTINRQNENMEISVKGRHDPCIGIRAVPIVEAMSALVLMDHILRFQAMQTKF